MLLQRLCSRWCEERELFSCSCAWASHCSGISCYGTQALACLGFSSCSPWAPLSIGSIFVAHGLSCSAACGIFPDQGSNPCLLHGQEDSLPLSHQGSPIQPFFICDSGLVELNCRNPSDLAKVDRFKSWHSLSDELCDLAHVLYLWVSAPSSVKMGT